MKSMILEARPWKRFLAFGLDLILLNFLVITPFSGWMQNSFPMGAGFRTAEDITGSQYAILFIIFMLALLYFTIMDYLAGQSLGMMALGIYTVEQDRKRIPGFVKCLLRNSAILPVFPLILLWALDPLFLLIKKARLSDMLLKVLVVEKISYSQTA